MTCTNIAPEMNIKPEKNRDSIRIRFRFDGRDYFLAPFPKSSWNDANHRKLAESIAYKIEIDIISGNFDATLEKYRHSASKKCANITPIPSQIKWLALWDDWENFLDLPESTKADHYRCVRRMIEKAGNPELSDISWLISSELAAITYNRRLSMLRSAIKWGIEEGKITSNPLKKIKPRTATIEEEENSESKKKPFNQEEIDLIIKYFSQYHPTYAPFVEFLLFSGVRTGEAIALRWQDIDLGKRTISIQQSISRERGKYKKIRKRPKTRQSIRILKMSDRLFNLFDRIKPNQPKSDDLIFKSSKGCIVDHGNFRSQYWKPALDALGVAYRKPYATRHTLLSMALEQGLTVPQVASIAGHKDGRMILQNYGREINKPSLPD